MYMENTHHHRYAFHFNVLVVVAFLALISFGIFETVSSQTGGDPYAPNNYGYVDFSQFGAPVNASNTNTGSAWWGSGNADRTTQGGGGVSTGSGTGYGTGTGNQYGGSNSGSSYYGNTGSYYNNGGIVDGGANRTQGGYIQGAGQGIYGNAGIVESGAVLNQGSYINTAGQGVYTGRYLNETLASPSQEIRQASTTSFTHCQFITKYHKFGDRGGDVPKIQQFLKDRGYYKGRIDGVYGISTFRAVQAFQRDYKDQILDPWEFDNRSAVEGTGITNISTKYAINKMVGCPDPATIVPKTGRILNY